MAYLDTRNQTDGAKTRSVAGQAVPDFDVRGRPLLYFTQPHGAFCPSCVRLGEVPYGRTVVDLVPRSRGVAGRCDACGLLCRAPSGPEPASVAETLSRALNAHEPLTLDDAWATTRRPEVTAEEPAVVELFWGQALYRCVVERVA